MTVDKSVTKLAILFADVSNSTRLYEQYGDAIARSDLSACIQLLAGISNNLGGDTIKTIGDEIMCAFQDPVKAALASTEMQASLRKACEEGKFRTGDLHIKIGWHFGSINWHIEEIIGETPLIAQQVSRHAKAGEILTTRQSINTLPSAMIPHWRTIDHIEAASPGGKLEICKIFWEKTDEETNISSVPIIHPVPTKTELTLYYNGKTFHVGDAKTRWRIGRSKTADLRVDGNYTSRQHAEITCRNGRFYLRDESVNGIVLVNEGGE
ncbi:MAG TPA: hypothetical protein DGR97_02210, partial [Gammaproteobacteria bacterium]|nr:hypothetical protein [Gammaproteobacteria bacterium]